MSMLIATAPWQDKGLVAYVNVDRDSASRLGISMADVDNALYNAFGQRLISTIYTQANQYRVVLGMSMLIATAPAVWGSAWRMSITPCTTRLVSG